MMTNGSPSRASCPTDAAAHDDAQRRDDPLRQVLETLERGIAAIMDSEGFARYLRCLARFHAYSPNNVALILAQRPEATRVAGYRAWRSLGRHVRRGERGIRIVIPRRTRVASEDEGADAPVVVTGYGVGAVFDISQTDGAPLIAAPIHGALSGKITVAEIVREELAAWLWRQGVTLIRRDTGRANGYYLPLAREIAIHRDLTGLREVKTLVHEAAHFAADHCGDARWEDAETVAESAAYVVLSRFGIDTGGYSFGYVAHWARTMEVFRRNIAATKQVAHRLILAIGGEDGEDVRSM